MAGNSKLKSDLAAHEQTYEGFIKYSWYGVIGAVVTAVVVLLLIAP